MDVFGACRGCIIVCLGEKWVDHVHCVIKQLQSVKGDDGLDESNFYLSLVADHCMPSILFNVWLTIIPSLATPPCPSPALRQSISRCMTINNLANLFNSTEPMHGNTRENTISSNLHKLLDNRPWNNDDYMLIDVVVSLSCNSLLSSELYGALLRLRCWHRASIYLIKDSSDNELMTMEQENGYLSWRDLSITLPAYIGPLSQDIFSPNVLWKGPMIIPEHCNHNSSDHQALTLHGLVLSIDSCSSYTDWYHTVGFSIDHTHHPSHLELISVIDMRDIPPVFLSPFTAKLSIDATFTHFPSNQLFNDIFISSHSTTCHLLRLYMTTLPAESSQRSTTDQWRINVLEMEHNTGILPMCPLTISPYEYPGPLLLVFPSSTGSKSCDVQLLWKPQALSNMGSIFMKLLLSTPEDNSVINDESDILIPQTQIIKDELNYHNEAFYTCNEFLKDAIESNDIHEYSKSPPKWPEIVALQTLEAFKRKQIRRTSISELTLGGVVAPPPTGTSTSLLTTTDLLDCFTDDGKPKLDLSPVAMTDTSQDNAHCLHMIDPSGSSLDVSYIKVLGSTPTTARKYHGVSYCFSDSDENRDHKLRKIQNRYVSSEHLASCSDFNTLNRSSTELRNRKRSSNNKTKSLSDKNTHPINESRTKSSSRQSFGRKRKSKRPLEQTHCSMSDDTTKCQTFLSVVNDQDKSCNKVEITATESTECNIASNSTIHKKKNRTMKEKSSRNSYGNVKDISSFFQATTRNSNTSLHTKKQTSNEEKPILKSMPDATDSVSKLNSVENVTDSSNHQQFTGSISSYCMRKILEQEIVAALKSHKIKRSHDSFNNCYIRLFKICKVYVKDLKPSSSQAAHKQVNTIVNSNVQQVISFELSNRTSL